MKKIMIQTVAALFLIAFSVYSDNLIVLAAASTTDALTEIGPLFTAQSGHTVQFSFGSAGALARQIQNGAPADLFLSANETWMDELSGKYIDDATRIDLLKNRLVLIAPRNKPFGFSFESGATLPKAFAGRLAVGAMDSVPAGMYAKQALENQGWLEGLKHRLVSCDSVRNVLFFVERGEVDAGIVYATDAKISERVTVVAVFPETIHDPIRYPAAICRDSKHPDSARAFLAFLKSPEVSDIFERYGFETEQQNTRSRIREACPTTERR